MKALFTKGRTMRTSSLDVLCYFLIKSLEKVRVEILYKYLEQHGISVAMDSTGGDLLLDSEDEDTLNTKWDIYDELLKNKSEDALDDEGFALDDEGEIRDIF